MHHRLTLIQVVVVIVDIIIRKNWVIQIVVDWTTVSRCRHNSILANRRISCVIIQKKIRVAIQSDNHAFHSDFQRIEVQLICFQLI